MTFKWLWILPAVIMLLFLPQIPGCVMANTPKVGRVIDITTGKGVPDAAVIAAAKIYAGSVYSGGENIYRVIVHTDKDGNYTIPGTWRESWSNLPFRFPGANAHISWFITAFKPNYAFADDEEVWTEYLKSGQPKFWPGSVKITPPASWQVLVVSVSPFKLQPVELSLRQAAIYYSQLFSVGEPRIQRYSDPSEAALREQANTFFLPKVCGLGADSVMDIYEAGAYGAFVYDVGKFDTELRKDEPKPLADPQSYPVLHAKSVCAAIMAGAKFP